MADFFAELKRRHIYRVGAMPVSSITGASGDGRNLAAPSAPTISRAIESEANGE